MSADKPSPDSTGYDFSVPEFQQRWININTKILSSNVRAIKSVLAQTVPVPKLMAVVKADAYGHGASKVAPLLRDAGAEAFGVTTLDEAMQLIAGGIDSLQTPVLLFAPLISAAQIRIALANNLNVTIADLSHLKLFESVEKELGVVGRAHLKVDCGMGRLGLDPDDALDVASARKFGHWAGVYTHFPNASTKDIAPTRWQVLEFASFCGKCKEAGVEVETIHCANSAAALRLPESRMDMVRIGTALYGQLPSKYVPKPDRLSSETFQMQARVVFTRTLKRGETSGYGSEFTARRLTKTAVLPVGFADGFAVSPNSLYRGWRGIKQILTELLPVNRPYVIINGRRAPVIGRVAMQMIIVDVTDLPDDIKMGDIADIPIRRLAASAHIPRRYE